MSDLNSYSFTGRLGADAELKYTPSGTAVWNARVGVGYGYGDNKGTNWITVQAFGKRAEGLGKLGLVKGAAVGGSGELRIRQYDTRDGGKGYAHEVTVQDVALLGPKPEGGQRQQPAKPAAQTSAPGADFADDDIPF